MSKEDKYEQLRQVCLSYRNEVEELREKLHKCMPYEDAQEFEDFIRNSEKEKYNQQISDLQEQLADMTKKYELASCPTGGLVDRVRNLEQQLAEKEEQIKDLTECNQYLQIYRNKDKISFCIEKLEKVLNFVDGRTYLAQYIKEQIEELKKGV